MNSLMEDVGFKCKNEISKQTEHYRKILKKKTQNMFCQKSSLKRKGGFPRF